MNGKVKKLSKGSGGEISLEKEFRRAVDVARLVPGVKDVVAERVRVQD
jgi:osmotically-inducible protein OsmY